jgi:hypothetical protein
MTENFTENRQKEMKNLQFNMGQGMGMVLMGYAAASFTGGLGFLGLSGYGFYVYVDNWYKHYNIIPDDLKDDLSDRVLTKEFYKGVIDSAVQQAKNQCVNNMMSTGFQPIDQIKK